jgi:arylsulfatase A-like enzyme
MKRPNVLFLLVDTLRSDKCTSNDLRKQLPNIHRLMDDGATFSETITVASSTPSCISSLFTGLYPVRHQVRMMGRRRLPAWASTMAEVFKASGYNTYASVAGPLEQSIGFARGFDEYTMRHERTEHLYGEWGKDLGKMLKNRFQPPFFAYIHFWEVHQPRRVLPQYDSSAFGETMYERAIASWDFGLGQILRCVPKDTLVVLSGDHGERIAENALEAAIDRYKSPLRHALKKMGFTEKQMKTLGRARSLLMSYLFKRGIVKDPVATLIGHGHHVYDYLVRVPFILSQCELVPQKLVYNNQVGQVDILPTLVDLLSLSKPKQRPDGRSLVPVLRGEPMSEVPIYMEAGAVNARYDEASNSVRLGGVRMEGWKYVYSLTDSKAPEELYNLQTDPREKNNCAKTEPQRKARLASLVKAHFAIEQEQQADNAGEQMSLEELSLIEGRLRDLGYMQ